MAALEVAAAAAAAAGGSEGGNGSGSQQQQQQQRQRQQQQETAAAGAGPSRPSTPVSFPRSPAPPPPLLARAFTRMLTPSGMAARLRPDLDPAAAALAASAQAARVQLKEIGAATHVVHFAFAAYGYLLYLWGEGSSSSSFFFCPRCLECLEREREEGREGGREGGKRKGKKGN